MSLHYDVAVACDLKPETPQQIIDTLASMTRTQDYEFHDPPAHEYFEIVEVFGERYESWRTLLQERSTHFPGEAGSCLRRAYRYTRGEEEHYRYTFSFRQEVNDDTIGEYWSLLEWLVPYSETEGLVGYFRSEWSDHPVLLYFKQGRTYFSDISQTPLDAVTGEAWPAPS